MSLTQQTQRRLPKIKEGLLKGLNYDQIAQNCGLKNNRTIDRDIKAWLESGEFETWIKEEWLRLHNIILHEDPVEAYRNISRLVSNMLTKKIEKKIEVKEEVAVNITSILAQYSGAINNAVKRDLESIRAEQQMDTSESQAATT